MNQATVPSHCGRETGTEAWTRVWCASAEVMLVESQLREPEEEDREGRAEDEEGGGERQRQRGG